MGKTLVKYSKKDGDVNDKKPMISMRRKMMYLYFPLLLVPLLLFALISSYFYQQAIIQRSLSSMKDHSAMIVRQVDDMVDQGANCATYLTLGINQLVSLTPMAPSTSQKMTYETRLTNELSYAKLIFRNIDSIAFVDTVGRIYTSDYQMLKEDFYNEKQAYLEPVKKSSGNRIWFDISKRAWLNVTPNRGVLTLGKKVWHTQTGKTIGYLYINLKTSTLSKGFDQGLATYDLIDQTGGVVAATDVDSHFSPISERSVAEFASKPIGKTSEISESSESSLSDDGFLMVKQPLATLPYTVVAYGAVDAHTTDLKQVYTLMGLSLIMLLLVSLIFSWFSNRWITRPILNLQKGVEALSEGRFHHRLEVATHDEIGLFAHRFNTMGSRIEELVEQLEMQAQRKRQFELALMQEQIKPHFLYNTLDIITKLIDLGDAKKAKRAAKKLAMFYKRSLSQGSELITLNEEILLLQDYMAIQNIRYGNAFELVVALTPETQQLLMPKLSLQPLVENAIYHGIKLREGLGSISIETAIQEDGVYLTVRDNGAGMPSHALTKLNQNFHSVLVGEDLQKNFESGQGFGTVNVCQRLHLFYGKDFKMWVSSDGNGTEVNLRLPISVTQ